MRRGGPLGADPEKHRAWQERAVRKAQERRQESARQAPKPRSGLPDSRAPSNDTVPQRRTRKPRRNDSQWRAEVFALRGAYCRRCGAVWELQCDHVIPRGRGGPSVVENGTVLCRPCHERKTEWEILYQRSWLDRDQVEWLAREGWVEWGEDGEPRGRGCRGFAKA